MRKHIKLCLYISLIIFMTCLCANIYYSLPYYGTKPIHFQNVDGNQIGARYAESQNGYGVIIANDLTHDKSELSSVVSELIKNGYGVFVFDFPSEGESEGYINFHYKNSSFLAEQFYNSMVVYSQISSLPAEKIHVVGYGEGARAVLETVGYDYFSPASLTLIGCSLNLSNKTEFDIINYVNDGKAEWISNLKNNISCNTHIIYSNIDEVSNEADNEALSKLLLKTSMSKVRLVPHSFLMSSVSVSYSVLEFISEADGFTYRKNSALALRTPIVVVIYAALAFLLYTANILLNMKTKYETAQLKNLPLMPKHFIKKKLYVHVFALPLGILTAAAMYLFSVKMPYFEIVFFIYAAYPVLMTLLYTLTDFCNDISIFKREENRSLFRSAAAFIVFAAVMSAISLSGTYSIFSFNSKRMWRLIFTFGFGLMFYIDNKERSCVAFTIKENMQVMLANYALFIILPILFLLLGLYNNACVSIMRLALLGMVLLFGEILNKLNCPSYLSSLYKGFIFQMTAFANMMIFVKQ